MADQRFAGKTAIVTGGAHGIGASTSRRLAREGAAVIIADLDFAAGERLAAEIGGQTRFIEADVAEEGAWRALLDAALALGGLDVVHVNAFWAKLAPADQLAPADWRRQIDVCLTQVYLAAHVCMTALAERRGAMVCTASIHAHTGFPSHPAYAAAKGGVCALVRQLAVEYGPAVRVNAVLPGAILTRVWDPVTDEGKREFIERSALRRLGSPDEVAAAVAFLASDDASFITGTELVVDGGWTVSPLSPTQR